MHHKLHHAHPNVVHIIGYAPFFEHEGRVPLHKMQPVLHSVALAAHHDNKRVKHCEVLYIDMVCVSSFDNKMFDIIFLNVK